MNYPMTVKETAKYLQIGRKLVYELIRTGEISAEFRGNRWEITALPVRSRPLTLGAVASVHAVSSRRLRYMIAEGRIEARKIGSRQWRIERSEAVKMLENAHFLQ